MSFSNAQSATPVFVDVRDRPAQIFLRHHLVGHGLDHFGAGDEHVAAVLHHEDEVGHRRRIDRPARARPHDHAELRHHAAGQHVALEHLGIAAKAGDAFLDARTAAVVEADHRRADLHRHVHDLADLLRVALAQRTAEHGEILRIDIDQPPVDRAAAGNHPVTRDLLFGHAEIGAVVLDVHVELLEAAVVEQHFKPLARGQLALGMLCGNALLTPAQTGAGAATFEFCDVGRQAKSPDCYALAGAVTVTRVCGKWETNAPSPGSSPPIRSHVRGRAGGRSG